ncbi:MAG: hypothetical protein R2789_09830 [Microthrixaceae bacterium]
MSGKLVSNTKDDQHEGRHVMAPSLWLTNFALLYTLNPSIAALDARLLTPIPALVAGCDPGADKTGFVQYSDYSSWPSRPEPDRRTGGNELLRPVG